MIFAFPLVRTILLGVIAVAQAAAAQTLWYTQPATTWVQALPVGNGSLGGMIFGGVVQEHIQFNEATLWAGDQTQVGSYQPFGDLYIDFAQPASATPTGMKPIWRTG